jgi:NitT/TauT family transport system substrate-binding protein
LPFGRRTSRAASQADFRRDASKERSTVGLEETPLPLPRFRLLVLSLLLVLAAPASIASQELTTLHLACPPADACTPANYAISAGLFRRAGLNVEMTAMRNSGGILAAVTGGTLQFGASATMPLIAAHAHGVRFEAVASLIMHVSDVHDSLMLVRKDSPIRSGADMNGKTFAAATLNDVNAISTLAWIDKTGGDSRTVHIVELPYPAMAAALDEGRVALATVLSPILDQALATGKLRAVGSSHDAIGKQFMAGAWFVTAEYAAANPDVIRRFATVMHEANAYANTHHAETVEIAAAFIGLDPAVVARSTRTHFGTTLDPRDIQPVIDVAARYNVIDKPFDARELINPIAQRAMR